MEKDNEQSFCPLRIRRRKASSPWAPVPRPHAQSRGSPARPALPRRPRRGFFGEVFKKSDPNEKAATNG